MSGNQVQWRLVGREHRFLAASRIRARFHERGDGTIHSRELEVQQDSLFLSFNGRSQRYGELNGETFLSCLLFFQRLFYF